MQTRMNSNNMQYEEWDFEAFQQSFPEMLDVDKRKHNIQYIQEEEEFQKILNYVLENGTAADTCVFTEEINGGRAMATTVRVPNYESKRLFYVAYKVKFPSDKLPV